MTLENIMIIWDLKRKKITSLLSTMWWQFGHALVGLLFQFVCSGSQEALLILLANLLPSTTHEGLHCSNHSTHSKMSITFKM